MHFSDRESEGFRKGAKTWGLLNPKAVKHPDAGVLTPEACLGVY
jgi:hypothetical protein